ncbi:Histidine kinase-like ATPase domain-containing protein [Actinacidiphila alni]|uniref:Histidine kinase-like ATPase domain-containing protein n=1 Tax=Actinacidiphila alni TaxID=380248 RepID=A0A1I2ALU5_9ACTN|nr:ATP-binding protein [Actinacidiphila alni]SFE43850.1 Histidine kinase-like ATPase domain-containing protein [Actinacidiphila alni]
MASSTGRPSVTGTPRIPAPRRADEAHTVLRAAAGDRAGVAAVRHRARAELGRWGLPEGVADDVVLVVSELVTNAVVHTVGDGVVCSLRRAGNEVRVEVGAEGHSEARADARPPDEGGRGLVVVAALSTAWGAGPAAPGGGWAPWAAWAAWATIAVPPAAVPAVPPTASALPVGPSARAVPVAPVGLSVRPGPVAPGGPSAKAAAGVPAVPLVPVDPSAAVLPSVPAAPAGPAAPALEAMPSAAVVPAARRAGPRGPRLVAGAVR